jgi:DeoR family glycerol-3-phosphate regulon repressor
MRLHKRQNEILASVKSRGACSIVELAAQLQVSDETIRRNIKPLVRQGLIEKVHGGVVLSQNQEPEPPFEKRMNVRVEEKKLISALVAQIISDGDSIMLDTGSTTAYVARGLDAHRNLSVVTNCTEIARTLAREPSNRVHICGGALRRDRFRAPVSCQLRHPVDRRYYRCRQFHGLSPGGGRIFPRRGPAGEQEHRRRRSFQVR